MIYFLSILGIILSLYTLYVFQKLKNTKGTYSSVCDISEQVSCTRVAKTSHAKMFGVPNGIWGILFYLILIFSFALDQECVFRIVISFGFLMSLYLAYQLYRLKILCPVCLLIYVINLVLLIWSFLALF